MRLDEAYGVKKRTYPWPYTGTGFISTKNGEILPEYYLKWTTESGEMPDTIRIIGIKVIAEGGPYSLGW